MRWPLLFSLLTCALLPLRAAATDFDVGIAYGQSRDFWRTVQAIQDRVGSIDGINDVVKDKYGKPDLLYSYVDASYAYKHDWFQSEKFGLVEFGTTAEAVAGGEISNPIFPQIQAYENTVGIASFGFRTEPKPGVHTLLEARVLGGIGPEKRLYAEGAELVDAIPVRSGTLMLAGIDFSLLDHSQVSDDFYITTDFEIRPEVFYSTTDAPASQPDQPNHLATIRWRLQNEWLKEVGPSITSRTRVGLLSITGQTPLPFLNLPVTWDYQQNLKVYSGLESVSGLGGIARFLSDDALPNLAFYAGYFGGGVGGGVNVQLGPVLLNASSYAIENFLTPEREKTRLWNASLGLAL